MLDLETWLRNPRAATVFRYAPVAMLATAFLFLYVPLTRARMQWLMNEDRPVEFFTFVFLFLAGCFALELARRAWRSGENALIVTFYLLFGAGCIFAAGDEIAWGQHYLNFETPADWKELNKQGETTIHNLPGLHGKTELLRLAFGLGGLIGVWLGAFAFFRNIAAHRALVPWFLVILAHGLMDVWNDFVRIEPQFDSFMSTTSELIELMIGMTATWYILLNFRNYGSAPQANGQKS